MEGEEDQAAVYERWEGCGPRAITNISASSLNQVQPLRYRKKHMERGEPRKANKCPGMYEIHPPPLSRVAVSVFPWLHFICLTRSKLVSAGKAVHYGEGGS